MIARRRRRERDELAQREVGQHREDDKRGLVPKTDGHDHHRDHAPPRTNALIEIDDSRALSVRACAEEGADERCEGQCAGHARHQLPEKNRHVVV